MSEHGHELEGTLHRLDLVANVLIGEDSIASLLDAMARNETLMPFFQPTAYIHGRERIEAVAEFLQAAKTFQAACIRWRERAAATAESAKRARAAFDLEHPL